jgi:uncharacterized membrane protein
VREVKRRDLESTIGGSWFNWSGIIAVTFGIAFFLKFGFDKQWIGPGARATPSARPGFKKRNRREAGSMRKPT